MNLQLLKILIPGSDFDVVHIGSTGFAQVGTPTYYDRAAFEGKFLLERFPELIGHPPEGAKLKWKASPYEIGAIQLGNYQLTEYHEIALTMDWNNKAHIKYFHKCEDVQFDILEEEINQLWLQAHPPAAPEDINHLLNPDKL